MFTSDVSKGLNESEQIEVQSKQDRGTPEQLKRMSGNRELTNFGWVYTSHENPDLKLGCAFAFDSKSGCLGFSTGQQCAMTCQLYLFQETSDLATSCLDYYNILCVGQPVQKLQLVQNTVVS